MRFILFVFFYFYHLFSFASPVPKNEDIKTSENPTAVLLKRARPLDVKCRIPAEWLERTCVGDMLPRAWWDTCASLVTGHEYHVFGSCPENTYCLNVEEQDGDIFHNNIRCVGLPKTESDIGPLAQQLGAIKISGTGLEEIASVPVGISAVASVSAMILSTENLFHRGLYTNIQ